MELKDATILDLVTELNEKIISTKYFINDLNDKMREKEGDIDAQEELFVTALKTISELDEYIEFLKERAEKDIKEIPKCKRSIAVGLGELMVMKYDGQGEEK